MNKAQNAARPARHRKARPPEASAFATSVLSRALAPIEAFLHVQASSGIVLFVAALVALIWANSPWHESYEHLWEFPLGLHFGAISFSRPLHFWVNDGLMTLFFFVVGLEIRREIHAGELSELRRALLPLGAALGGMLVPALVYALAARGTDATRGWGVPMATDIAFALGALALLGKRVPPALRVLLLALAVIDDIGGILVIAIFYSSRIEPAGLLAVAIGIGLIFLMQKLALRRALFYAVPGVLIWAGMLFGGIHPTLAGVVVGLLTPARAWIGEEGFVKAATEHVRAFEQVSKRSGRTAHDLTVPLSALAEARREALAPVERLEAALHSWVAFGIMPLFALANAGVALGGADWTPGAVAAGVGVALGLVLGKPLGIFAASFILVRARLALLPRGVTWRGVWTVGLAGGIGFTMSLFIAQLAFPPGPLLTGAKLAILGATVVAGGLAVGLGTAFLRAPSKHSGAAATATEAESSAEA